MTSFPSGHWKIACWWRAVKGTTRGSRPWPSTHGDATNETTESEALVKTVACCCGTSVWACCIDLERCVVSVIVKLLGYKRVLIRRITGIGSTTWQHCLSNPEGAAEPHRGLHHAAALQLQSYDRKHVGRRRSRACGRTSGTHGNVASSHGEWLARFSLRARFFP
jgi:hypothetical protein